ncbi:MAG: metallophosphoesterase family protein [Oscillospiraceae bacterium]|jgi:predicted phosphodiesterase|nr:metallophosphoesterase family protein [Oscillospiraceae bacterium]
MDHIDRAYKHALRLPFDNMSRIVFMSDCHRGYGGWADSFAVNAPTFLSALRHYDGENYTYIELGDGDELWENRRFMPIASVHHGVFTLLRGMLLKNRFYMLYGNHDIEKKRRPDMMHSYYDATQTCRCPLFPGMQAYESMILSHRQSGQELFLIHGHQADYFNDNFWLLSRFLVRHLWKPLQAVGIKAPASAMIDVQSKIKVEKRLMAWSEKNNTILIAGHTHRPQFPAPGQTRYFNDGSCVRPRQITAIELSMGALSLVAWRYKTRADGTLYVGREFLAGPYALDLYSLGGKERVDSVPGIVVNCRCPD